jgi:hypothetical protein
MTAAATVAIVASQMATALAGPPALVWTAAGTAALGPAAAGPTAAGPTAFRAVAADHALMARVLAAARVERVPEPPSGSYLRDLWAALNNALAELARRATAPLNLSGDFLIAAVALLGGTALVLLVRALLLRRARAAAARREAAAAAVDAGVADDAAAAGRGAADWDAAAWRREMERCLGAGKAPAALRAAWWWLARTLAGGAADAAWTGRELLRRSGRDDLREEVRRLDRLVYGSRPAALDEVRRLAAALEASLR